MVVVSLALAPLLMAGAAFVERRLGPSAAGWVAALPITFAVTVLAVSVDLGTRPAAAMATSAATHVAVQVVFALVVAVVLRRRGLVAGVLAGVTAYVGGSLLVAHLPAALSLSGAVALLMVGPRLMPRVPLRPASARGRWSVLLTGAVAIVMVAAAVLISHRMGPEVAGAAAAFPTMSLTFAVVAVRRDGRAAGVQALTGLVRSLPCYLVFCLATAAAAPLIGYGAIPVGLLAALTTALLAWRGVSVIRRPALAGVGRP